MSEWRMDMKKLTCAVLALSFLAGCISAREVPLTDVLKDRAEELASPEGLATNGWVMISGIKYELEVTAWKRGDHLVFGDEPEYARPKLTEVRGILFNRVDAGKTAGNTGKGVLGVLAVLALIALTLGASLGGA